MFVADGKESNPGAGPRPVTPGPIAGDVIQIASGGALRAGHRVGCRASPRRRTDNCHPVGLGPWGLVLGPFLVLCP